MEKIQTGAVNIPGTIKELKTFCDCADIPVERMRFLIGIDGDMPMAYGVYKTGDDTVFYKNRIDGTKVIIYHGPDEMYAVTKFYLKIQKEDTQRRAVREFMSENSDVSVQFVDVVRKLLVKVIMRIIKAGWSVQAFFHGTYRKFENTVSGCRIPQALEINLTNDVSYFV